MNITITMDDQISAALRRLGADMPRILNLIVASIAKRHKERVRSDYLSGRALNVRTGELRDAIFYYRVAPGVYDVRPVGNRFNWAGIFEDGGYAGIGGSAYISPSPFQKPALQDTKSVADRIINDIANREIAKRLDGA